MKLIFNGITNDNHLQVIKKILRSKKIKKALISTAFVTEAGFYQIEEELKKLNSRVDLFFGYNNTITSMGALTRAFNTGCNLFLVGSGNSKLFHPKIYLAENSKNAELILGSANLTEFALAKQYEASVYKALNTSLHKEKIFLEEIYNAFSELKKRKETIFINNFKQIKELEKEGFLEVSRVRKTTKIPKISKISKKRKIANINLKNSGGLKKLATKKIISKIIGKTKSRSYDKINRKNYKLVWRSKELTRRHLSIPEKTNSHPTYQMGLGEGDREIAKKLKIGGAKGAWDYFPKKIFKGLKKEPNSTMLKRKFKFHLEIFGKSHGNYYLDVSHDPEKRKKETGKQLNTINQLYWGDASNVIRNPKYLNQKLSIYKNNNENNFLLEIN